VLALSWCGAGALWNCIPAVYGRENCAGGVIPLGAVGAVLALSWWGEVKQLFIIRVAIASLDKRQAWA